MGDSFNITVRFNENELAKLARFVAKRTMADCSVAVGVADIARDSNAQQSGRLEPPLVVCVSSDGDALPDDDVARHIENITSAASMYYPGSVLDYDIQKSPVLTLSMESDEQFYGALFVSVVLGRPTPDFVSQLQLVDLIEEEVDSFVSDETASRPPEEDPYIAWYYGSLFGDIVLDTQDA